MAEEKKKFPCETCAWRASYDQNPKSLKGRLWKWHTYICPGWKAYQRELARQAAETEK